MFDTLTIEDGGRITLPAGVQTRYGFKLDTPIRIIETQSGVLLVPLTQEPMSETLMAEIEQWQALGAESLAMFPFEDDRP